jgi:glycosyltransferase involved in cell wall biosynthesis
MHFLAIGHFGYHEETITLPILNALERLGATLHRVGGDFAFFLPENFADQPRHWLAGLPDALDIYDALLFLDYWHMGVPMYLYRNIDRTSMPPFLGVGHGSAYIDGDLCLRIPHARDYEDFLWRIYDAVTFPPSDLVRRSLPDHAQRKIHYAPYPIDHFLDEQPQFTYAPKIYHVSRWRPDKGSDRFANFAQYAATTAPSEVTFAATGLETPLHNIKPLGWLTPDQLRQLARAGGYFICDARQEIFPNAVVRMFAYGLTPLYRADNLAYSALHLPERLAFTSYDHALQLVADRTLATPDDWAAFRAQHADNATQLAQTILAAAQFQPQPEQSRPDIHRGHTAPP